MLAYMRDTKREEMGVFGPNMDNGRAHLPHCLDKTKSHTMGLSQNSKARAQARASFFILIIRWQLPIIDNILG